MIDSRTNTPLETRGLGKDYGEFAALRSLDLAISEGTCFGYLGPNGAGKTTTIKIATDLLRPTRGKAFLFGVDVRREPRKALARVGTVIETPEFYGYLTPLETLAYVGRLRGMARKEIAVRSEDVLRTVKLEGWADRRIQKFSKGMKQRLAIAQALLNEPDLVILDEPTSGLDPRGMAEVRDIIKGLKRTGRTVFMSSHLLGEVQEVCDDVALLNHGQLLLSGSVEELSASAGDSSIAVSFASPVSDDDVAWISTQPGISATTREAADAITLRIPGDMDTRARVLATLVHRGLPVSGFRSEGSPLEQLYMEHIKESERA
jgi:ABC-2 type transport system ATP-binding protein